MAHMISAIASGPQSTCMQIGQLPKAYEAGTAAGAQLVCAKASGPTRMRMHTVTHVKLVINQATCFAASFACSSVAPAFFASLRALW